MRKYGIRTAELKALVASETNREMFYAVVHQDAGDDWEGYVVQETNSATPTMFANEVLKSVYHNGKKVA